MWISIENLDCWDTENNGIDFRAYRGCKVFATADGRVSYTGIGGDGGISVDIEHGESSQVGFKTIYYHLLSFSVSVGQRVFAGDLIGLADNTGTMSTGDHLHFGLKMIDSSGKTLNHGNGYFGAIDPAPYFFYRRDGVEIKNKDWDKARAYHCYYLPRKKWNDELVKSYVLWKNLGHRPNYIEANAYIYGEWSPEDIKNPALYPVYSQIMKLEFLNGIRPYSI